MPCSLTQLTCQRNKYFATKSKHWTPKNVPTEEYVLAKLKQIENRAWEIE